MDSKFVYVVCRLDSGDDVAQQIELIFKCVAKDTVRIVSIGPILPDV